MFAPSSAPSCWCVALFRVLLWRAPQSVARASCASCASCACEWALGELGEPVGRNQIGRDQIWMLSPMRVAAHLHLHSSSNWYTRTKLALKLALGHNAHWADCVRGTVCGAGGSARLSRGPKWSSLSPTFKPALPNCRPHSRASPPLASRGARCLIDPSEWPPPL